MFLREEESSVSRAHSDNAAADHRNDLLPLSEAARR